MLWWNNSFKASVLKTNRVLIKAKVYFGGRIPILSFQTQPNAKLMKQHHLVAQVNSEVTMRAYKSQYFSFIAYNMVTFQHLYSDTHLENNSSLRPGVTSVQPNSPLTDPDLLPL